MADAGPGPVRSSSAHPSSHRSSPYGSRPPSSAPLSQSSILLRSFLQDTVAGFDLNPDYFPIPSDANLRDYSSEGEIIVPLLCAALAAINTVSTRCQELQKSIEEIRATPSVDPSSLATLEATVRDLSHRVTASATARHIAPMVLPPPQPPKAARQQPAPRPPQPQEAQLLQATTAPAFPPSAYDPDIPVYNTATGKYHGNPANYAARHPQSFEAQMWCDGKYPPLSEFLPGESGPPPPLAQDQPGPSARPSYAATAAAPVKGGKKSKVRAPATAAQVAASNTALPPAREMAPLPAAQRRFYAPRTRALPHQDALRLAATAPDIAASVLREANCSLPLSFTASVNPRGALTLLTTNVRTSAADFSPYYEALAAKFNQAFPIGDNPFLPFRPAPNDVQFAIHGLPYDFMPTTHELLLPALSDSVKNATGVTIFSARFLQPDPDVRSTKRSGTVVISVAPADADTFGSSIKLFSRPRHVERVYPSNKFSQCRNCCRFGHISPRCKQSHPTCPICSLAHKRSAHRCVNPTCPLSGHTKPVPSCCPTSVPKCINCDGKHEATYSLCPSRPKPPSAQDEDDSSASSPEANDQMDTTADPHQGDPHTPTGGGAPFDPTTPKAPQQSKALAAPHPKAAAQVPSWVAGLSSSPLPHPK